MLYSKELSVITCTYNSENFILENLNSLVPYESIIRELIIIDAESFDSTLPIIKSHKISNLVEVKVFQFPPSGVAKAMNYGATNSSGRYLLFLNSDDYLNFDYEILHTLEHEFKKVDESILLFNCNYNSGGKIRRNKIDASKLNYNKLFKRNLIFHPATIINNNIFKALNHFNDNFKFAFDYDFWIRASLNNKFKYIDLALSTFRVHDDSLSYLYRYESIQEVLKIRINNSKSFAYIVYSFFLFVSDYLRLFFYDLKRLLIDGLWRKH